MSDTPRTDAVLDHWWITDHEEGIGLVADHARKLERELSEALERLAERDAENAVLRDAINDALPWMIKLGDYIGNGTQADPMGRCNAILKMRISVEKRDD